MSRINSELITKLDGIIKELQEDIELIKRNIMMRESIIIMLNQKKAELITTTRAMSGGKEINDIQKLMGELEYANEFDKKDLNKYNTKIDEINKKRHDI